MATSDEDAALRSVIQVCFPSGLRPIATFCQLKSSECYKNVSRMFQEHLHILGIVDLATVSRIIHHVGGQSIRIAK